LQASHRGGPGSIPGQLMWGRQTGIGTGFSLSTSVLSCQYHYINAPYAFNNLLSTWYNLSKRRHRWTKNSKDFSI